MDIGQFEEKIKPLLGRYLLERSSFENGDFGNLDRIEIEGCNILATIDFWSKGWISIDVYDCLGEEQIMNVLLSPDKADRIPDEFNKLLAILIS